MSLEQGHSNFRIPTVIDKSIPGTNTTSHKQWGDQCWLIVPYCTYNKARSCKQASSLWTGNAHTGNAHTSYLLSWATLNSSTRWWYLTRGFGQGIRQWSRRMSEGSGWSVLPSPPLLERTPANLDIRLEAFKLRTHQFSVITNSLKKSSDYFTYPIIIAV